MGPRQTAGGWGCCSEPHSRQGEPSEDLAASRPAAFARGVLLPRGTLEHLSHLRASSPVFKSRSFRLQPRRAGEPPGTWLELGGGVSGSHGSPARVEPEACKDPHAERTAPHAEHTEPPLPPTPA